MSGDRRSSSGWQPLSTPTREPDVETGRRRLNVDGSPIVTPFNRLARTHALHAMGDASYAVALVGSIFALDTDAARGRILLYLLLTLAPFAIVGPLIGPALDRIKGGRRIIIVLAQLARAILMLVLVRNIETFWLFPIAFTVLVTSKTYSVAKAATVPTTVDTEQELVEKNARLAVLGTVAGGIGAAPALGLQAIWGSTPTLFYASAVYLIGTVAALRLPRVMVDDPDEPDDVMELRSAGVRLAATVMSVLRGITGFVFWLMVFAYGSNDIDTEGIGKGAGLAVRFALGFSIEGDNSQPAWKLGFVLASIGGGIFLGNVVAPLLRARIVEEHMIIGALGAVLAASFGAIWAGGLSGAVLLALIAGMAPATAKLAFDSLVQRDAPGAAHGAAFGRFETRFQVASVVGSVLAVAPSVIIPVRVGALVVAIGALVAGAMYTVGSRTLKNGEVPGPPRGAARRLFGGGSDDDPVASEPDVRVVHTAAPTTEVAAVPSGSGAVVTSDPDPAVHHPVSDPYGEAFADRPVEPPDWSDALFGERPAVDPLLPPNWISDPGPGTASEPDDHGEPTPPLGTPRVEG